MTALNGIPYQTKLQYITGFPHKLVFNIML